MIVPCPTFPQQRKDLVFTSGFPFLLLIRTSFASWKYYQAPYCFQLLPRTSQSPYSLRNLVDISELSEIFPFSYQIQRCPQSLAEGLGAVSLFVGFLDVSTYEADIEKTRAECHHRCTVEALCGWFLWETTLSAESWCLLDAAVALV